MPWTNPPSPIRYNATRRRKKVSARARTFRRRRRRRRLAGDCFGCSLMRFRCSFTSLYMRSCSSLVYSGWLRSMRFSSACWPQHHPPTRVRSCHATCTPACRRLCLYQVLVFNSSQTGSTRPYVGQVGKVLVLVAEGERLIVNDAGDLLHQNFVVPLHFHHPLCATTNKHHTSVTIIAARSWHRTQHFALAGMELSSSSWTGHWRHDVPASFIARL